MIIMFKDTDNDLVVKNIDYVCASTPDEDGVTLITLNSLHNDQFCFVMTEDQSKEYLRRLYSDGKADLTEFKCIKF